MNNDNIVKIGTALKWRSTFDITKKYYQENLTTVCGCVFRCKVLQAQGKSPVKFTDEKGHLVYTNTDVWDVVVDMEYFYNYSVDTKQLTKEVLEYVKKLDEAIQNQQKEIEAIKKDDLEQWKHIKTIEKKDDEQQREIDSLLDTYSCYSEGIWIDTLLWSNTTLWDNNKYAITDDLQNQINGLSDKFKEHEAAQKIYEETNDLKLLVLSLGAKTTLSISPNVAYKNVRTQINLTAATVNLDYVIDELFIKDGERTIATTKEHKTVCATFVEQTTDKTYIATTKFRGLELKANATMYFRNPIYHGFGSVYSDVVGDNGKLSPRLSAAGTYRATNTKNNKHYYILVPQDISALSDFIMGGAPYVMIEQSVLINNINYRLYVSGAVYDAGATVNITAK